jgi:hypothetical protein
MPISPIFFFNQTSFADIIAIFFWWKLHLSNVLQYLIIFIVKSNLFRSQQIIWLSSFIFSIKIHQKCHFGQLFTLTF